MKQTIVLDGLSIQMWDILVDGKMFQNKANILDGKVVRSLEKQCEWENHPMQMDR